MLAMVAGSDSDGLTMVGGPQIGEMARTQDQDQDQDQDQVSSDAIMVGGTHSSLPRSTPKMHPCLDS